MARGFLLGALSGTVVAAGVGSVASVLAPPIDQGKSDFSISDIAPQAVETPNAVAFDVPKPPAQEGARPASPTVVLGATPKVDTLVSLQDISLQPAGVPQTVLAQDDAALASLDTPSELPTRGSISLALDGPVPRPDPLEQLAAPTSAPDAFVLTAAPRRPAPLVPRPKPEKVASDVTLASVDTTVLPQVSADLVQPEIPQQAVQPVAEDVRITPEAPAAPEPEVIAQAVVPDQPTPPRNADTPSTDAMAAPATAAAATEARPRIGKPAVSLTQRSGNVVVNRLATTTSTPAETTEAVAATEAEQNEPDPNAPPIQRFAQAFENADGKPLMSVVLIDNGEKEIGNGTDIADLRDFPYALSFAVDSELPDAQDRVAMYRAEGFEVLGMIDMPAGALARDAETTLEVLLPQLGEIIGVLEGNGVGLQETREISDQVTAILSQSGHGLVAQAKGLNTMPNLARKAGVPAAPVFRDFDSKGQGERVIRRFLDQAAFKAGQEGAVIMLGRLRPETISALLVWGLQDRAGTVALAPVSAVLTRNPS